MLLACRSRRARVALGAALVLPLLLEWLDRRPDVGVARWVGMRLADDVGYQAGVWAGAWRSRSVTALLPRWT
jgi:hypothetical protein